MNEHKHITRLKRILRQLTPLMLLWLFTLPAHAQLIDDPPSFEIQSIRIEGLSRMDAQSAQSRIYTQVGQELDRGRLSEDLKRLYALGTFDDVQVAAEPHPNGGITLIFRVEERPTITTIAYQLGGSSVDEDDIRKAVDLKALEVLDEAKIRKNIQKIRDLYADEGHFLADVDYRLIPEPDNRVRVEIYTEEGDKVEVRRIDIVGNDEVPTEEITSNLATREGGWLSFLTKSGEFKQDLFDQDLQRIQYIYLTKGYVQIRTGQPSVTLSSDRSSMEIVIPVEEGPRYRVGKIDIEMLDGDWLEDPDTLHEKLSLIEGDWFDYQKMSADAAVLSAVYRDQGYANAHVSSDHHVDAEGRTFGVTFKIQKGDPVYIRRIEIQGNKDTRDKVIRREMKIAEGELYSGDKIRRSQRLIMALGFFHPPNHPGDMGGVAIDTRRTDDPRLVDLVIKVKEKQTGTFQVGAGFSSYESFLLTAQVSKENIFGRGQTLSAQLTLSGIRQLGSLSFYEPYFFDTDVTFAIDLFNYKEIFTDFSRLRQGGNLSFGYRFTDELSFALTYTLERVEAELRRSTIDIQKLRQVGVTSSLRGTLSYDTRDNRLFPTDGQYSTVSFEYAPNWLGSENEFWRLIGRTRWYVPLFWDFVLRLNGTAGVVQGLNGQTVPLFERFFVGGIFTVRGFERNSIGERLALASVPDGILSPITIGGTSELIFNAEVEFPIFKEVGIRGVVFFDAGNAWGGDEAFDIFDLRTAAGFGLRWNSPVGPLRFEWGFPLAPRKYEKSSVFEFTIGNSF